MQVEKQTPTDTQGQKETMFLFLSKVKMPSLKNQTHKRSRGWTPGNQACLRRLMIKSASFKSNLSMAKDEPWVLLSAFKYLHKVKTRDGRA